MVSPGPVEFGAVEGSGDSLLQTGVLGKNTAGGRAVHGISDGGIGVTGDSLPAANADTDPDVNIGVQGSGVTGVLGQDGRSTGKLATSGQQSGGHQVGVLGIGAEVGVYGSGNRVAGVLGAASPGTAGVQGEDGGHPGSLAGNFIGNVAVSGNVEVGGDLLLTNQDIAEQLPVEHAPSCEPGMVVVLDDAGIVRPCWTEYDTRVVGVVAGSHTLKPAIRLGHAPGRADGTPVALVGVTYCLVDADVDPIAVGDLLTSAARSGHARKAAEPARSFGAVIGKALAPLRRGQQAIPIVVALQ